MTSIDLLSAAKVKSLKAPGDYLDGRGLYLQVRSETSKSWLLKYSLEKRTREMGLGFGLLVERSPRGTRRAAQADQARYRSL